MAGYPLQDVKVDFVRRQVSPRWTPKEVAFIAAGKKAFIQAVSKANPVVLEPVVNVDITVPQDNMGDIAGDISSKRGRIIRTEASGQGMVTISGQVPLGEMKNYTVTAQIGDRRVKALTAWNSVTTNPVPSVLQKRLSEEFKPTVDDD